MTASHATIPNNPSSSPSWLDSFTNLCVPLTACFGRRRSKSTFTSASISWPLGRTSDQELLIAKDDEKQVMPYLRQEPMLQNPSVDMRPQSTQSVKEKPRKSFASGRTLNTLKKRFRSDGSARPLISGPSDFRHVQSGSYQFPPLETPAPQPRPRRQVQRRSFRPLELSIYMPDKQMSPMLPHFEFPSVALPEPAQLHERLDDEYQLLRGRSNSSSTPFHLPRRPGASQSPSRVSEGDVPAIPAKSRARARAHTSPELDCIRARVAGAMNEVDRLQKQIDDVIERQSIYVNSRPSTAHSMAFTIPDPEPLPSVPALPPSAPSFAERLSEFDRPQTAPLKTAFEISNRSQEFGDQTSASTPTRLYQSPPPGPLAMTLRPPPLRKKKSFSRVSSWLFPHNRHERDFSLDSITNLPRPVKGTEGFYQCVAPGGAERRSFDTIGTVTTWDSEEEPRTVPTTLSPGSTPVAKTDGPVLERSATFGRGQAAR